MSDVLTGTRLTRPHYTYTIMEVIPPGMLGRFIFEMWGHENGESFKAASHIFPDRPSGVAWVQKFSRGETVAFLKETKHYRYPREARR